MKVRKTLLVGAAGWAALAAQAMVQAQIPALPAAAGAAAVPAAPLGIAPGPAAPGPTTIWQKLGLSKDQKEFCKRKLCATPLGQLINNSKSQLTVLSGGLIPPFCPTTPSAADLADPGAVGAASAIQADEAGAPKRRAAVRYLGTVDCHYWPEAEDALVASLRGDRNECVRWEAAMALGSGCCCTKKTIEALTIVTSCSDRDGAPKETSNRVHAAAAAALDHCLACFCNVAAPVAAPATAPPPIEGARPPVEGAKPTTPPVPTVPEGSVKSISPGEVKPAPSMSGATVKDAPKRPVGPEYYARIAKIPLAAILTEARRVAEQHHGSPTVSDTPFAAQGHTVAAIMNYASGPDTQAVVAASMTSPSGEMRAEVVSARPANLWDILTKPENEPTTNRTEVVIVPAPKPVVAKTETVVVKTEPVKKPMLPATPARQTVSTPVPTPKTVAMPPSAPMTVSKTEPTLDFPPPAMPMPMGPALDSTASAPTPSPYFATKESGTTVSPKMVEPVTNAPSPYFATKGTGTAATPKSTEAVTNAPSPYFATMSTAKNSTARAPEPATNAPSPYFATKGTGSSVTPQPTDPVAPGVSSYFPTAATPAKPMATSTTMMASPYNSATPMAPAKPVPAPLAKTAPGSLPTPAAMPTVPMSPRPMPAPPAPVVPASMPAAVSISDETVGHLLATARGNAPVEVRKTSIQELVKLKANTPEVMAALDSLSDDPVPSVRAEAVIAGARLKMGR
jgi:hypothetical protein